jgi:manganese/iron transport system permease protein
MAVATAIAALTAVGGLYLSYYAGVAGGAAVAGLEVAACALTVSASALRRHVARPNVKRLGAVQTS